MLGKPVPHSGFDQGWRVRRDLRDSGLEPLPPLAVIRKFRPHPPRAAGKCDSKLGVAAWAQGPIEGSTNIVALRKVDGFPIGIAHAQPIVRRGFEVFPEILRMTACQNV